MIGIMLINRGSSKKRDRTIYGDVNDKILIFNPIEAEPINLDLIHVMIVLGIDLTMRGMRTDIKHRKGGVTPTMRPLLGIETNRVTEHIQEVRHPRGPSGVRLRRLVPHGGCLAGVPKEHETDLRILIRK